MLDFFLHNLTSDVMLFVYCNDFIVNTKVYGPGRCMAPFTELPSRLVLKFTADPVPKIVCATLKQI